MLVSQKIMSRLVLTIQSDKRILDAYQLMFENNLRHLPVINENNETIGMLSDRDVQRAMIVSRYSRGDEEIFINASKKVSEYMTYPVKAVHENTSITFVIEEMVTKKISAVMVKNNQEEYTGILTTDDILKCFLNSLKKNQELKDKSLALFMSDTLF